MSYCQKGQWLRVREVTVCNSMKGHLEENINHVGVIMGMSSANEERRCYVVTLSLISRAHAQKNPGNLIKCEGSILEMILSFRISCAHLGVNGKQYHYQFWLISLFYFFMQMTRFWLPLVRLCVSLAFSRAASPVSTPTEVRVLEGTLRGTRRTHDFGIPNGEWNIETGCN